MFFVHLEVWYILKHHSAIHFGLVEILIILFNCMQLKQDQDQVKAKDIYRVATYYSSHFHLLCERIISVNRNNNKFPISHLVIYKGGPNGIALYFINISKHTKKDLL